MAPLLCSKRFPLFAGSALFLAACLFTALPALSQQPQLDSLAAQAAHALNKAHAKSVIVLDFSGPGLKVTGLGRDLADQFSSNIAKLNGKFEVVDRTQLLKALASASPSFSTSSDLDHGPVFKLVDADCEILGHIELAGEELHLTMEVRRIKESKSLGSFRTDFTRSENETKLLGDTLSTVDYPEANAVGYTLLRCLYCPVPPFSKEAAHSHSEGTVLLAAVIEPSGHADQIILTKAAGHGLDEEAIKGVKEWKFEPAIGPDGKPAAVRLILEVEFRFY